MLIIRATLLSSYSKNVAKLRYEPKDEQFVIHCFPVVYIGVSCKKHFGVLTLKFVLNQITTHKMASFQTIVTRVRFIVLSYSYSAYHQNDTLKASL